MSNNTRIWSTIGKGLKEIGKVAILIVPIIITAINKSKK